MQECLHGGTNIGHHAARVLAVFAGDCDLNIQYCVQQGTPGVAAAWAGATAVRMTAGTIVRAQRSALEHGRHWVGVGLAIEARGCVLGTVPLAASRYNGLCCGGDGAGCGGGGALNRAPVRRHPCRPAHSFSRGTHAGGALGSVLVSRAPRRPRTQNNMQHTYTTPPTNPSSATQVEARGGRMSIVGDAVSVRDPELARLTRLLVDAAAAGRPVGELSSLRDQIGRRLLPGTPVAPEPVGVPHDEDDADAGAGAVEPAPKRQRTSAAKHKPLKGLQTSDGVVLPPGALPYRSVKASIAGEGGACGHSGMSAREHEHCLDAWRACAQRIAL